MRTLLKFFLLTYAATWICWATSFAILRGSAAANPALTVIAGAVLLLGGFAPGLIALLFTERGGDRRQRWRWSIGSSSGRWARDGMCSPWASYRRSNYWLPSFIAS